MGDTVTRDGCIANLWGLWVLQQERRGESERRLDVTTESSTYRGVGGGAKEKIWKDEGERGWAKVVAGACCIRCSVAEAVKETSLVAEQI